AAGYAAFKLSPWPAALIIRRTFDTEGEHVSHALEKHLPSGVSEFLDQRYDETDGESLDVFYPSDIEGSGKALTTIVWVHGGGWIAGSKDEVANYLRILAGKGFTVAGVDYSLAPARAYPTPVRQVLSALAYLGKNAERLHVDTSRIVLAGDSAGAQIAAQTANVISVPSYAEALGLKPTIDRSQLRGLILYCGPYDIRHAGNVGSFGAFVKTVLWSYSGTKDYMNDPRFALGSVIKFVTPDFPPTFISAGNGDPLMPQSRAFADVLANHGVRVDSLFFPDDYSPALPHEYQYNLDTDAGRLALERSVKFLSGL
ncbi:MAG TPA: alpha/beta hydrolase, partial [Thermodesulfobacteriota bacterium]|nr:alpha/beta hydrolase [Thermodesulfobacteriota bacterium]